MKSKIVVGIGVLLSIAVCGPAAAGLIVTDHVIIGMGEYTADADLTGQSCGSGFSDPWNDIGVHTFTPVTTGLTAVGQGSGGSIKNDSDTRDSYMKRPIDSSHTTSDTYYFSSMIKPSAGSDDTSWRAYQGYRLGTHESIMYGPWYGQIQLRIYPTMVPMGLGWDADETLLFVGQVEFTGETEGELTLLVNPTDLSSWAQASATAEASAPIVYDFGGRAWTRMTLNEIDTHVNDVQVRFDEFLIGTTFADLFGGGGPIPGDANEDGKVTDADAAILATNWQKSGVGWSEGDFNADGSVTDADAAILATHWQEGTEAAAAVPEPTALLLLVSGLLPLLIWRRGWR